MQLFLTILSLSLSGALIGLMLLLVHPITQRLFSKRWNYYIWLLVVARLLIPVHFPFRPISLPTQNRTEIPQISKNTTEPQTLQTAITMQQQTTLLSDSAVTKQESNPKTTAVSTNESAPYPSKPAPADTETNTIHWVLLLLAAAVCGIIWLFGIALSLLRKLRNYQRFVLYIQSGCFSAANAQIQQLAEALSKELGIKKTPVIYKSTVISSPITIGLWKPFVILPQDLFPKAPMLTQECFSTQENSLPQEKASFQDIATLRLILLHEFIHIARKDLWYKWIFQLLLSIHWFNPVFHIISKTINIDCELSCDEAVLAHIGFTEENKRTYGNLLLDTAQKTVPFYGNLNGETRNGQIPKNIAKGAAFSTTLLERKSDLKKRLNGILYHKKRTTLRFLLSVCAIACVLILSACSDVEFFLPDSMDDYFTDTDTNYSYNENIATLYYDDQQIAGKDISDRWVAYSYQGMENKITASGFVLSGSDTIKIIYATGETDIQIDTSFKLTSGNFKVVHIAPDNTVTTVSDESGKQTSQTITLQEGRNVLKMIGAKAKLQNLSIEYSDLKNAHIDTIYNSEDQEYIGLLLKDINSGNLESTDIKKIIQALPSIKENEASDLFKAILDCGVHLTKEELVDFFIFSNQRQVSQYLIEALESGTVTAPDIDTISSLMPYFADTYKADLLVALPAVDFPETFRDCLPYLNSSSRKQCCEYLAESMQNGTITLSKPEIMCDYMPYLSSGSRSLMLQALPIADFYNVFSKCVPYLNSSETEECLLHYLDAGGTLNYTQFSDISPYLSSSTIRKIDNY